MDRLLGRGWMLVGLLGAMAIASGCATAEDEIGDSPFGSASGASAPTGGTTPLGGGSPEGATATGGGGVGAVPATGGVGAEPATGGVGAEPATGGVGAVPATGGVGAVPATGGVGAAPATGGAATGGGGSSEWEIGTPCDNTQQPPCGDTDMWCEASACTCGTGDYCAETGACYWEGGSCP